MVKHGKFSVAYLSIVEFARTPGAVTHGGLKAARRASTDSKIQTKRQDLDQALSDIVERPKKPLITQSNQRSSHFLLKLPPEVRELVYSQYYEDKVLTISEICSHFEMRYAAFTIGTNERRGVNETDDRRLWNMRTKALLSLPLSCRQIYLESINYLYSNHTFRFDSAATVLSLHRIFLPKRIAALTSLEIDLRCENLLAYQGLLHANPPKYIKGKKQDWVILWRMLAELPYLEKIRVNLRRGGYGDVKEEKYDSIFAAMIGYDGKWNEFEVSINWEPSDPTRFEGAPFQLVRVGKAGGSGGGDEEQ